MPLNTAVVGGQSQPFTHEVDARWLMAYAAGLGDCLPCYLDTHEGSVIAHPVFPVCLEWPTILDCVNIPGSESSSRAERARGVHASHDLHILRPIRAGEQLTTRATVTGLVATRAGATQTTRLDTLTQAGELVCQTYQVGITRGVEIEGEPRSIEAAPEWPVSSGGDGGAGAAARLAMPVAANAAHVYTECARIWNPIHTDRAVALAAGLPDIILHGTATLALAVSRIVADRLDGNPARVTRLGGRFRAMVLMPSTLTLVIHGQDQGVVSFTVLNAQDEPAISHGFLCYG